MTFSASAASSGLTTTEDHTKCKKDEPKDKIDKSRKEMNYLQKPSNSPQKQNSNDNSFMLNNTNDKIEDLDKEIVLLHEGNKILKEKVTKAQIKTKFQDITEKPQILKEEIEEMDKENTLKFNYEMLQQRLMKGKTWKNVHEDKIVNLDSRG